MNKPSPTTLEGTRPQAPMAGENDGAKTAPGPPAPVRRPARMRRSRRDRIPGAMDRKGFRKDIQGIRGFALVLVLLTHAEIPFTHGGFVGLDIFFVLSGFLITGLIVAEFERKGSFSPMNFYARRAKRILPLVFTVLITVTLVSLVLFSALRRELVAQEVIAAGLYFVNWHFAAQQVDYFEFGAADISPVQHYWSLSVEEQFYVVWPVLLIAGSLLAARRGWHLRGAMFAVVGPLAVASLAYSIWFTASDPQSAYFATFTRVWELAAGGLLALTLPIGIALGRRAGAVIAGAGLLALVVVTVMLDGSDPYPGWRALIPVLATLAIIYAGTAYRSSGPITMLTRPSLQYLGRISYAWYLWHWPVIVFGRELLGNDLSPVALSGLTLLAWVPAAITHRAIEEPFRRSKQLGRRPKRALALGFACTAGAVVLGLGLQASRPDIPVASTSQAVGAQEVDRKIQQKADAVRPAPADAVNDWGRLVDDDCRSRTEPGTCVYGDPSSDTTVVIWGDSHAVQYFPTLHTLARDRDWRLVGLVRAGCTVADVNFQSGCDEWRARSLERIRLEDPDLVVVANAASSSSYRVERGGEKLERADSEPLLRAGMARSLRRLRSEGAEVRVILDQPRADSPPAECVAESLQRLGRCAFEGDRKDELAYDRAAAERVDGAEVVDPLPLLCPDGRCPAVIGSVVVYRDEFHLTATFARTLAPWLARQLPV